MCFMPQFKISDKEKIRTLESRIRNEGTWIREGSEVYFITVLLIHLSNKEQWGKLQGSPEKCKNRRSLGHQMANTMRNSSVKTPKNLTCP